MPATFFSFYDGKDIGEGDYERTLLHRQIEAADRQIDRLVYELYDLTEEEIGIVEDAA